MSSRRLVRDSLAGQSICTSVSSACSSRGLSISVLSALTSTCSHTPQVLSHCISDEYGASETSASTDGFLPVQGQMLHALDHLHLGPQARDGEALVDRVRFNRRLGESPLNSEV